MACLVSAGMDAHAPDVPAAVPRAGLRRRGVVGIDTEPALRVRPANVVVVMIVLGNETSILVNLLRHSNWDVHIATSFEDAAARLRTSAPAVVVAPYHSNGSLGWVDLLEVLRQRRPTPRLVLTDRHTDAFMWAEALNLGAYDVLAQPFESSEVFQVLTSAWQAWRYDSLRNRARSD